MAKLIFRYGAMGSSKTANALMVQYNYKERGQTAVMLKPKGENRDGEKTIRSRIGLETECEYVDEFLARADKAPYSTSYEYAAVIVDEAQFLTTEQVNRLAKIADDCNLPVICYGLRTDFKGNLFEGSKRLMELADDIEEIPTVCWCGKKARFNARVKDGKVVYSGEQIMLGGDECYTSLCRKHFLEGKLK